MLCDARTFIKVQYMCIYIYLGWPRYIDLIDSDPGRALRSLVLLGQPERKKKHKWIRLSLGARCPQHAQSALRACSRTYSIYTYSVL